ncbi:MAG: O-acetyl-ADP-ribose deacetylase [Christensenellales bacterium]
MPPIKKERIIIAEQILIVRGDITQIGADAIVNAANTTLSGGGGVDGAIHRAAGPKLLQECRTLNGCETGRAKATKGYGLKAGYIFHTPGPVWQGGHSGEDGLLASCYQSCLELAVQYNCKTVAFPSISTGVYRFPLQRAASIAISAIQQFLYKSGSDCKVIMVCFDDTTKEAYETAWRQLTAAKDNG